MNLVGAPEIFSFKISCNEVRDNVCMDNSEPIKMQLHVSSFPNPATPYPMRTAVELPADKYVVIPSDGNPNIRVIILTPLENAGEI